VIIATRTMSMPEELVEMFRCRVPGVAPLLFTGGPDRDRPVRYADRSVDFATVELELRGVTLHSLAGRLPIESVLSIGSGMVEMVEAAAGAGCVIFGIRPEVAYAEMGDDWRFTGLTPMVYTLLGHEVGEGGRPFEFDTYHPPEIWDDEINQRADVFSLALVLWYLATGHHAYSRRPDQESNICLDQREPWPGSPDVGAALESALVSSYERRASIDEFGERLRACIEVRR